MYKLSNGAREGLEDQFSSDQIEVLIAPSYKLNFDLTEKSCTKESKLGKCPFYRFRFNAY